MRIPITKFISHQILCVIAVLVVVTWTCLSEPVLALERMKKCSDESLKSQKGAIHYSLPEVAMYTVRYHFGLLDPPNMGGLKVDSLEDLAKQMSALAPATTSDNTRIKGIFVTLSKKGKTRACWGNLQGSSQNLVRDTVFTTMDALKKDYRHPQIRASEVNFLKPQVTVIRKMQSINSVAELNPLKDGLMLRQGGRSGVVLPGEAYDSHHQLVMCKMKAGVSDKGIKSRKNSSSYQLYRLEADVFK
ncbi:MAG: AMMECR1 domain-containing protein [Candidatus Melainabacteria bacterium]|nr:AMMECR1 domain-containing protein [Candidatus Melainabacteria bacterium]